MDDAQLIERCIELARLAAGHGNHPFGALIVHEGRVIAEGENRVFTELDPSAHAEVVAVRGACRALGGQDLSGCTLYTSAEPCLICSTVVRLTGISRVVFAAPASGAYGGYSSIYPILRDTTIARFGQPPEVVPEFLAERSLALWRELGWPPPPR
jgi:tRNA(Arg) A34 adenosine deaminase TadA